MDISHELLREHSAKQTQRITAYVCARRSRLPALLHLFSHGSGRERQLAAEIVGNVAEKQPQWLVPHLEEILTTGQPGADHHPAVRRGLVRALQFVAVPEEWQAPAFDTCLALLRSPAEPIATKVYALTAATRLALSYPELAREVLEAAQRVLATMPSPAFRSRAAREFPTLKAVAREGLLT